MTEDQFHRSVAQYLALVLKPPTIWTTIPAGGGGAIRGAQLKGKGLQPGWPDIIVISPDSAITAVVVGIELKTKKGRMSSEQSEVRRRFWSAGAHYGMCRDLDEVKGLLKGAGII